MAANWKTAVPKLKSFFTGEKLAAWAVAGGVAYYLWIKPSQDLEKQYAERAVLAAAVDVDEPKPRS